MLLFFTLLFDFFNVNDQLDNLSIEISLFSSPQIIASNGEHFIFLHTFLTPFPLLTHFAFISIQLGPDLEIDKNEEYLLITVSLNLLHLF